MRLIYSYTLCLLFLFLLVSSSEAQQFTTPTYSNIEFEGLIKPIKGKGIKSDGIILRKDFVLFRNKHNNFDTLTYDKVRFVNAYEGNLATEGMLIGAILFLGGEVFWDATDDGNINNGTEIAVAATVFGGGIGLIWGLLSNKQRTVYSRGKLQVSILNPKYDNYTSINSKIDIIKLSYSF